jgi:hypothetical protein
LAPYERGLFFEARVLSGDLAGLPELVVESLPEDDARTPLDSVLTGRSMRASATRLRCGMATHRHRVRRQP